MNKEWNPFPFSCKVSDKNAPDIAIHTLQEMFDQATKVKHDSYVMCYKCNASNKYCGSRVNEIMDRRNLIHIVHKNH